MAAGTGGTATLSVGVSGTGPFGYEWYFGGAPANINGTITTVAGGGIGDGAPATNVSVRWPNRMAVDASGNLFIADHFNSRIRKVGTNGIITTVAGNVGYSSDGDTATNTSLNTPTGIAVDAAGDLFIADSGNNCVRKVGTNGSIIIVAGNGTGAYSGDGGAATNAGVAYPSGIAVDAAGNLFILDGNDSHIRKVGTNGIITTVAGNGTNGYLGDGGAATNAELNDPFDVAVDAAGNLFIADSSNHRIRKVSTSGIITTVAGIGTNAFSGDGGAATNAAMAYPSGIAVDAAGNLFIGDTGNARIREVGANGIIITVAGNGNYGFSGDGGAATNALLNNPYGVAVSAKGNLFIADSFNNRIREVGTNGIITTAVGNGGQAYSGNGGAGISASLYIPCGVRVDTAGDFLIADSANNVIRKVSANGIITTVAGNGAVTYGNGTVAYSGDGGAATSAPLNFPNGIAVDTSGNLFIADTANNCVREVGTNGIIITVAGNRARGYSGDGEAATNASLYAPVAVAVDTAGGLFIADNGNNCIRKVATNGIIITVAGTGYANYGGDGGDATSAVLNNPCGMALDAAGNLFIADSSNSRIREVGTNGIITTVAGNGTYSYSGDGGAATNASMYYPSDVAVDTTGNLFIMDSYNNRIRKVGTNGIITTVAGSGTRGYSGDGEPATSAAMNYPQGLALDAAGNLFIADTGNNLIRKVAASDLSLASGGASLVVSDLTTGNVGDYYVVITNAFGSATSSLASLSLLPQFTRVTLDNESVGLNFGGMPLSTYVVLYATNLAPPVTWTPLTTNSADGSGNVSVVDTNTAGISGKFYRISSP